MKHLRRAPRAVYRVYDEDDFLSSAPAELDGARDRRGGVAAVAGAVALLVGAAAVFGGLFASGRRLPELEPGRGETRSGAGDAPVSSSAGERRPATPVSGPRPEWLPRHGGSSRVASAGRRPAGARTMAATASSRGRRARARTSPVSMASSTMAAQPLPGTAPASVRGQGAEFGFER